MHDSLLPCVLEFISKLILRNVMAKDFLNQELNVGDKVILFSIYKKIFIKGKIWKINKGLIYIDTGTKENNLLKRDSRHVVKMT